MTTSAALAAGLLAFAAWAAPALSAAPGPVEAIAAAAHAPSGAEGAWVMRVTTTGRADGNIYLNSAADYRDQLNLSVALLPQSVSGLRARFGNPPEARLRGKLIRVEGVARRVQVFFASGPVVSSKFYYQTHVAVADARQITVLDEGG